MVTAASATLKVGKNDGSISSTTAPSSSSSPWVTWSNRLSMRLQDQRQRHHPAPGCTAPHEDGHPAGDRDRGDGEVLGPCLEAGEGGTGIEGEVELRAHPVRRARWDCCQAEIAASLGEWSSNYLISSAMMMARRSRRRRPAEEAGPHSSMAAAFGLSWHWVGGIGSVMVVDGTGGVGRAAAGLYRSAYSTRWWRTG